MAFLLELKFSAVHLPRSINGSIFTHWYLCQRAHNENRFIVLMASFTILSIYVYTPASNINQFGFMYSQKKAKEREGERMRVKAFIDSIFGIIEGLTQKITSTITIQTQNVYGHVVMMAAHSVLCIDTYRKRISNICCNIFLSLAYSYKRLKIGIPRYGNGTLTFHAEQKTFDPLILNCKSKTCFFPPIFFSHWRIRFSAWQRQISPTYWLAL